MYISSLYLDIKAIGARGGRLLAWRLKEAAGWQLIAEESNQRWWIVADACRKVEEGDGN